jgi:uncharacterized repeat protein (TIGR01451 family)
MKTILNFLLALALLLGLVFFSQPQPALAEEPTVATFDFTSSPNPSAAYQEVTFSLSATGTNRDYDPFGYVKFFDDGAPISGCDRVALNFTGSMPESGLPAKCTTRLTTPGAHTITADFTSYYTDPNATLTLEGGQTVTERLPITFDPETLPDGFYGTNYSQNITPTCGGVPCELLWWINDPEPPGMNFQASTPAQLWGWPAAVGTFSFTVQAEDSGPSGALGSHTYTLNVQKATPEVTFQEHPASEGWINLLAYVKHPNPHLNTFNLPQPAGTVSFFLDDDPLAGCSGMVIDPWWGYASCYAQVPADLQPGSHPVRADFTPNEASGANYNSGSGTWTLNVPFRITGLLFKDLDQDGVRDVGETPLDNHQVNLDQGCDGSVNTWVKTNLQGLFVFENVTPGDTYCLSVESYGSWRVTTALKPFTVVGGEHFEIGLQWVELAILPETLPNGSVGEPYYQEISISGGTGPYTIDEYGGGVLLPAGITFDQDTLTVSGTPTSAGFGWIVLYVADAEGITGKYEQIFFIQTDGVFTLTSDANPSDPGQEVTFTFTGAVNPDYDLFAPFGVVAFYDGEDLIEGCEAVWLNYDPEYWLLDQPAVCRTAALAEGDHEIRADFTQDPVFALFRDASRTLTQVVQVSSAPSADLAIDKTDSKDPVKPGAKLVYTLTVRNNGPDAAQNITLVDTLDRTTTYVSTSAPKGWACTYANSKVTCTSVGLASGSTTTIKITVTVNKDAKVGKELVNNASVLSETPDPDSLNNSVVQKTLVIK